MAIKTNGWLASLGKTSNAVGGISVSVLIPALLALYLWFLWELSGLLPVLALWIARTLAIALVVTLVVHFLRAFFGESPAIADDPARLTSPWSALLPFLCLAAAPALVVGVMGYFHRQNENSMHQSGSPRNVAGNCPAMKGQTTYFQTPLLSFTERAVDQIMDSL